MALRDQPYIPLYVQDFLTDEKLRECRAASVGVYAYIMCLMHKSKNYGKILLQQKDQQNTQQIKNFAEKLLHHLPYDYGVIELALHDLLEQEVLYIEGYFLCQRRMIRDNNISEKRAKSGSKGGKKTAKKHDNFATAKRPANDIANSEYEYEYVNESEDISNKKSVIPDLNEFLLYCQTLVPNYSEMEFSLKAKYQAWIENNWKDGNNQKIKNWKTKIQNTIPHLKPMRNGNKQSITDFTFRG